MVGLARMVTRSVRRRSSIEGSLSNCGTSAAAGAGETLHHTDGREEGGRSIDVKKRSNKNLKKTFKKRKNRDKNKKRL